MIKAYLQVDKKTDKKYKVVICNTKKDTKKTIRFGAEGYSDYTKHKDKKRKDSYISRHKKNENWKKSGVETAGFWSRWLLWNKPTIKESIKDISDKFDIKIHRT